MNFTVKHNMIMLRQRKENIDETSSFLLHILTEKRTIVFYFTVTCLYRRQKMKDGCSSSLF